MRGDRLSAYQQFDLSYEEAMQNEFEHGMKALVSESVAGATRFAKDKVGRHGSFDAFNLNSKL